MNQKDVHLLKNASTEARNVSSLAKTTYSYPSLTKFCIGPARLVEAALSCVITVVGTSSARTCPRRIRPGGSQEGAEEACFRRGHAKAPNLEAILGRASSAFSTLSCCFKRHSSFPLVPFDNTIVFCSWHADLAHCLEGLLCSGAYPYHPV